jgi:hypothetical protein
MRIGRYQFYKNLPLTSWHHGERVDPKNWPWWKRVAFDFINLKVTPPTRAWRFWIYTRRKARDFDFFIDRRPE